MMLGAAPQSLAGLPILKGRAMSPVLALLLIAVIPTQTTSQKVTPPATRSLATSGTPSTLMKHLEEELEYSMQNLATEDGTKPYYLGYTVYDEHTVSIGSSLGAIVTDNESRERNLNIEVRVGDYKIDNTHQLRGGGPAHVFGSGNLPLPLGDDPLAVKHAIWVSTDEEFKNASKRLTQVKTDLKVKVEEEDRSDDFSREKAQIDYEEPANLIFDRERWAQRLRKISAASREFPTIYQSNVTIGAYGGTRYIVTSEGTRLQNPERRYRITMTAATKADDGMELSQFSDFNAASEDRLPDDATIEKEFRAVIKQVLALREAPLAEPYIGPAILRNRASGVFFHEIFGHRIEGHRQKDVTEGQTFTKKLEQQILPDFITVYDDPTMPRVGDIDLRGFYRYDDQGVAASRAVLVDKGMLKTFLMSRTPLDKVSSSNGHGRRQPGNAPVSRQANLVVESSKQVPFDELKKLLVEECKKQGKPYGLLFEDISGGFTTTSRRGPQSFKVLPIVVYRVYADGKPDELIRGADIVGTPLTSFEKITYTGDDLGVFNGSCGAESGWVPVSAASPSILVSTIEIEKRTRDQSRPPILPSPLTLN